MILIILVISTILAALITFLVTRSINKPVQKLAVAADKLALGDVDVNIEVDSKDEIGMLAQSFRNMADNIKEAAQAVEQVAAGDVQVAIKIKIGPKIFWVKAWTRWCKPLKTYSVRRKS